MSSGVPGRARTPAPPRQVVGTVAARPRDMWRIGRWTARGFAQSARRGTVASRAYYSALTVLYWPLLPVVLTVHLLLIRFSSTRRYYMTVERDAVIAISVTPAPGTSRTTSPPGLAPAAAGHCARRCCPRCSGPPTLPASPSRSPRSPTSSPRRTEPTFPASSTPAPPGCGAADFDASPAVTTTAEGNHEDDELQRDDGLGARQCADVLDTLGEHGLPAEFTQTGGMCAVLEVQLENGHTLLIADADDYLSWARPSTTDGPSGSTRPECATTARSPSARSTAATPRPSSGSCGMSCSAVMAPTKPARLAPERTNLGSS